jgi:IS4 transposase
LEPVVRKLQKRFEQKPLLPGFPTRILDGNHLAATEHRIQELQEIAAGPLPGQVLAVLDPDRRLIVDAFPCVDGHAQERSLLIDVLDSQEPGQVWIADRNFCTTLFLLQTACNDAYFAIREHAANAPWEAVGERRKVGRTATGVVYEQRVEVRDKWGGRLRVRRITIYLDEPTEEGDTEIHILTNLPKRVKATRIAEAYRGRWRLENAFGELAAALNCEISSLGYPPAALFAFGVGLLAYNILSVVRTALAAVHGEACLANISAYYLADEIRPPERAANGECAPGAGQAGEARMFPQTSTRPEKSQAEAHQVQEQNACRHRPYPRGIPRKRTVLPMTASQGCPSIDSQGVVKRREG